MDLKDYLKTLQKNIFVLGFFTALGLVLAFVATKNLASGFTVSQTLFIEQNFPNQQQGTYNYEGYYSQEKARNFTDTAVAILDSADFKSHLQKPGQALTIRKVAPQVIRLTATAQQKDDVSKLLTETKRLFNEKVFSFYTLSGAPVLREITQQPEPHQITLNTKATTSAGAVLGLAFAILVISLKTYFKI